MTGSLQIKNNRYHMVINYIDDRVGRKNKWISTGLTVKGNKKAAEAMLNKWLTEHEDYNICASEILFCDYLERWIKQIDRDLQESTLKGYRGNLKNHIIPYFKNHRLKLADVRVRHLEDFYSRLIDEKSLSAQSVRHCHRIISKAMNDAIRLEMIASNPASLAKLPKIQKYESAFLTYPQIKELIAMFKGHILEHVVRFICTYGMRRSEALGLCWDKVDFENNQFTICRAMIQGEKGDYLKDSTKNSSSCRTLPLTPETRVLLLELKERREEYSGLFPSSYAQNNLVFVWEDGHPITTNYLSHIFHEKVINSDLPYVRLHDLRHSAASNLLHDGMTLVEIQKWLGHSQPSTTLNFYSHTDARSNQRIGEHIAASLER